jgi:hypothetical protein
MPGEEANEMGQNPDRIGGPARQEGFIDLIAPKKTLSDREIE